MPPFSAADKLACEQRLHALEGVVQGQREALQRTTDELLQDVEERKTLSAEAVAAATADRDAAQNAARSANERARAAEARASARIPTTKSAGNRLGVPRCMGGAASRTLLVCCCQSRRAA